MDIVFAKETAVVGHLTVIAGQHWPADDPIVLEYPGLFTHDHRLGLSYSRTPTVETATAAPGERRALSKADQAFDEADQIREELDRRGIKYDKRLGLDKLRQALAEAGQNG